MNVGKLTDMLQAALNNEIFGQMTVQYNLQKFILHNSSELFSHIKQFMCHKRDLAEEHHNTKDDSPQVEIPKVLGDVWEALAAAILLDCDLDVAKTWKVLEPLMKPFYDNITPDNVEIHPIRELLELCQTRQVYPAYK
jgi:endoribonuclease Dicer